MSLLNKKDKQIIKLLQENSFLALRPFNILAQKLKIKEEDLIKKIKDFKKRGVISSFGARISHENSGYKFNAMVVWQVPEKKVILLGEKFSVFPEVSHCYERPAFPDFPYNLYTMIHAQSEKGLKNKILELKKVAQNIKYKVLITKKEYKKTEPKYFL
ncbi:MAG: Lrp/AsnC family transcriptional regulator [Armatimonadetes bacterium]|nr:Lrp/AsnC family transcriptional regulator [Armatimonadota bacterium]